jgi:acetyltransferase
MYDYRCWRSRPPRVVVRFPVNRRRVERILARNVRAGRRRIPDIQAKEILQAYDFTIPPGHLAGGVEEALDAAEKLGYPVSMKISSREILDPSDAGGVRRHLSSREDIRDAHDLIMLRTRRHFPEAIVDGVWVEKMTSPGREVVIGMTRDEQFGPMLMFGLGGISVEVMEDVAFHLAPITADEAMEMLRSTRSYKFLQGDRGGEQVDLAAIASGLQRLSQLATDFPQVQELEVNPLVVGPAGVEPVVADASITLAPDLTAPLGKPILGRGGR